MPLLMPGIYSRHTSRSVPLRREEALQAHALVLSGDGVRRLVDLWLLHHRYGRVDAASSGL